jgi:DNA replication licensing factor MCM2
VLKWIKSSFQQFLYAFREDGGNFPLYEERINDMCTNNRQSLDVNFPHLSTKIPTLAIWVAEEPTYLIPILNSVAQEVVCELFPEYNEVHSDIFVRIKHMPIEDNLRDLRQNNLNSLIMIRGVVVKRTGVFPEMLKMFFRCKCGDQKGPFFNNNTQEAKSYIGQCVICHANGPYVLDDAFTVYRNYQKLTVQETPGTVPAGRVPRQKEVVLLNDLIDCARPGDEVEITGIYLTQFDYLGNVKYGFPVFSTSIEANYIRRMGDEDNVEITEEDKVKIKELSKMKNITPKLVNSIAPSIYGHNFIKKALSLAMFGGQSKDVGGKHQIRGDINVLVLGDPGTAKS